jgi:phosphoribosyl-AMP cyclohydrolase
LNYALSIGLIETPEGKGKSAENITSLWLTRHPFLGRLDDRESSTCRHLVDLVRSLVHSSKDGWVSQSAVLAEMNKNLRFGYSREEQEYWISQAIYHQKVLEMRKDNNRNVLVLFIRVNNDAKVHTHIEKQVVLPTQKEEITPRLDRQLQKELQESSHPEHIIQIFLSYAHVDFSSVINIYERLSSIADFQPWMDKKNLLGGEKWKETIEKAIKQSDFFLVCLTKNSMKRGFLQSEIKIALEICKEMPENEIFLIPIRLEDCYVPEALREIQWVNLHESDGWSHLERSIRRAYQIRKNIL